jgi:hypothetical protein
VGEKLPEGNDSRVLVYQRRAEEFFDYVNRLEARLRLESLARNERVGKFVCQTPVHIEALPFPLDGRATGFEDLLAEEKAAGELEYDVPPIKDVCALDLVSDAFDELKQTIRAQRAI